MTNLQFIAKLQEASETMHRAQQQLLAAGEWNSMTIYDSDDVAEELSPLMERIERQIERLAATPRVKQD